VRRPRRWEDNIKMDLRETGRWGSMRRTGFSWLRIGPVAGFREHGNEPSCSIKKSRLLIDKLRDYQLYKEYPPPWSE
jgi:hypothetical protein